MTSPALLHLLHLVSPALPIGAYAYSQGLEFAIESGELNSVDDIENWLAGVLEYGLGYLDLPMLATCMRAWRLPRDQALIEIDHCNDRIRASRETRELLLEDEQLGMALRRLLQSLDVPMANGQNLCAPPSFVCQFALAAHHWDIAPELALQGFAWSWLENQVAAATKLVPLGQTQAQVLLVRLMSRVAPVCQHAACLPDDEIGLSLAGLAIASSRHERQYSRLFRS